ncbi:MAG: class I adenylate cyclase [Pseudomonadota bacterium]
MSRKQLDDFSAAQELDRFMLNEVKKRFIEINSQRLTHTSMGLNDSQRYFFQALPLLLHINNPLFPGFISRETPCSIEGFEPSPQQISALKNLIRPYEFRKEFKTTHHILSVFMMGSTGSIAHSGKSDMDIWICHQPNLSPTQKSELDRKLKALEYWARRFSMEVHFFMVNAVEFKNQIRAGDLDEEDCGSTQHFLLLDEFYRTAVLLAGRYPAWWLVPPKLERKYSECVELILKNKFVNENEMIDFGGIPIIPSHEYLGATIWHLYKSIDSPQKSILKLLLTESYASEYPDTETACLLLKELVYSGISDTSQTDPYVLTYRKIERYLMRLEDYDRLELARRFLYLKVSTKLSKPSSRPNIHWRQNIMQDLVNEWGWGSQQIAYLDHVSNWKSPEVINERESMINEMTSSYHFLTQFARQNRSKVNIDSNELAILGRKLHAAFEKKKGKIERINPHIAPDISEESLLIRQTIVERKNAQQQASLTKQWQLIRNVPEDSNQKTVILKRAESPFEIIAWAFFNGIIARSTQLITPNTSSSHLMLEMRHILNSLENNYPEKHVIARHEAFATMPVWEKFHIFINVGVDPLQNDTKKGVQRLSSKIDALSFSGLKTNLIMSIDYLAMNSWKEIVTNRLEDENATLKLIQFILTECQNQVENPPAFQIECFSQSRSQQSVHRLQTLIEHLIITYFKSRYGLNSQFIINIGDEYLIIEHRNRIFQVHRCSNYQNLIRQLGQPKEKFCPIILDSYCLQNSLMQKILEFNVAETIQIFLKIESDHIHVLVLDEHGCFLDYKESEGDLRYLMQNLFRFVRAILDRRYSTIDLLMRTDGNDPIAFFEIQQLSGTSQNIKRRDVLGHFERISFVDVTAMVISRENNKFDYVIHCGAEEFSQAEYGEQVFEKVAQHILHIRKSDQNYPVRITDLDLSGLTPPTFGNFTTIHYLSYKTMIESKINQALRVLRQTG